MMTRTEFKAEYWNRDLLSPIPFLAGLRDIVLESKDPAFAAKLRDVVGLYLDPPAHSLVLSVDEKSQIQALDRTQPGLPIKKGRAAR
jgi:hypothetical protein